MEEPDRLQFMGHRLRYDLATEQRQQQLEDSTAFVSFYLLSGFFCLQLGDGQMEAWTDKLRMPCREDGGRSSHLWVLLKILCKRLPISSYPSSFFEKQINNKKLFFLKKQKKHLYFENISFLQICPLVSSPSLASYLYGNGLFHPSPLHTHTPGLERWAVLWTPGFCLLPRNSRSVFRILIMM